MGNKSPIDQFKRTTARRLRENATDAETKLWHHLRALETRGTHFRRQQPIGNFIVDFACLAARLVIEVDGSQHGEAEAIRRDTARTQWLENEGYRVLRFWNNEITRNIEGVLDVIYAALYGSRESEPHIFKHMRQRVDTHPTPARSARRPSPSRGG
jgi:very-short-patch-repair endonuclease